MEGSHLMLTKVSTPSLCYPPSTSQLLSWLIDTFPASICEELISSTDGGATCDYYFLQQKHEQNLLDCYPWSHLKLHDLFHY